MPKKQTTETTNAPAFEAKLGSIRVTVWKNTNDSGAVWHNVTVERPYKNNDGEWSSSHSLTSVGDVTLAIEALQLAKTYIIAQEFNVEAN